MVLFTDYHYDSDSASEEDECTPLSLPSDFADIPPYVELLFYPKPNILGIHNTETVLVTLTGYRPHKLHAEAEDLIRGRALIRGERSCQNGYCIGVITGTDTGVIISEDLKMYAFAPPESGDYKTWKAMDGHPVAEIIVDSEMEIRLRFLCDLEVTCLG